MIEQLIEGMKPVPIMVIGDVMADEYVLGDVERISPESPVPVIVARDRFRTLGGAGNVVRNIVSLGGSAALFGVVGKDAAGAWLTRYCEEIGVETFWLRQDEARPTTVKTRVVARNQQIVRIDQEQVGDISTEMAKGVITEIGTVMRQVRAVVVSDYGKGFLTPPLLRAVLDAAQAESVPVLVDPKGMDYARYKGASYLTPNVREASAAAGIEIRDRESLVEAGNRLLEVTAALGIVLTRGREGIALIRPNRPPEDFPVKPVEIIDVTGAGDTVIATLAMTLGNGMPIDHAVRMANFAAGIVVSRFGAAAVTLKEMLAAVKGEWGNHKVVSIDEIAMELRRHRVQGKKIVFTNGCFDLFHAGHLEILRRASEFGDVMVVGVNSDASVKRLKGEGRPIFTEAQRTDLISSLEFVNLVVVFEEDTPLRLIRKVKPDVLVKGEDWRGKEVVGQEVVQARGGRVEFVKHVDGLSTSAVIKKIRGES
ncbi:MAG: D-glycero-beta-D-manno-heptose-7-phosphate kinase [Thermodesulfobacteriota bacterium]